MMRDPTSQSSKHILVIINPAAGQRQQKRLTAVLSILRDQGCQACIWTTSARGDAKDMARKIDPDQFDVVAIAGGDGTINEVLNGIDVNVPPVAIIPIGTANVLAAEIGLETEPRVIADTITSGCPQPINLGIANGQRFAVMASMGFDAEVVSNVNLSLKRYFGKGAYALEALRQLLTYRAPVFKLSIDDEPHGAHSVIIANGRYFGGRFIVAPDAHIKQPSLDICLLYKVRSGSHSAVYGVLWRGAIFPIVAITQLPEVSVFISPDQLARLFKPMAIVITHLPAKVSVLPNAIELMFPRRPKASDSDR